MTRIIVPGIFPVRVCVCVCVSSVFSEITYIFGPILMKLRIRYRGVVVPPKERAATSVGGATPKKLFLEKNSPPIYRPLVLIGSGCLLDILHFIGIENFSRANFWIAHLLSGI